ncbi:hypothetical protein HDV05_008536 [Chytridiales sp. JEL 0842]|nr:hypothetical protein HDV05_008536 [Chytridiales sp. JEL 0842]
MAPQTKKARKQAHEQLPVKEEWLKLYQDCMNLKPLDKPAPDQAHGKTSGQFDDELLASHLQSFLNPTSESDQANAIRKLASGVTESRSKEKKQAEKALCEDAFQIAHEITFSSGSLYVQECKFIAGILMAWMLELYGSPSDWAPSIAFATSNKGEVRKSAFVVTFSEDILNWKTTGKYDYSFLSVARGLLSTIKLDTLVTEISKEGKTTTLMAILYDWITHIADRASDSSIRVMSFQTLASWFAVLKEAVKSRSSETQICYLARPEVFEKAYTYVFTFWEDTVDSIQHKLRDVFQHIIEIINVEQNSYNQTLRRDMLNQLLAADWHKKVKYDLLSHMLNCITPKDIMILKPTFLHSCLGYLSNRSISSRISAFLFRFFSAFFNAPDYDNNQDNLWTLPLLDALTSESVTLRKALSDSLLRQILEIHPKAFDKLLKDLSHGTQPYRMHGLVSLLRAARSLGYIDEHFFSQIMDKDGPDSQTYFSLRDMHSAISHSDLNLRSDICGLICETKKGIADPSKAEMEILKLYIVTNSCVPSSDFRNRMFSYIHKFVVRLRRTMYANNRDIKSLEAFREKLEKLNDENRKAEVDEQLAFLNGRLNEKHTFLKWLVEFGSTSLFPGATYSRITSGLSLLQTIREAEQYNIDTTSNDDFLKELDTLCNRNTVDGLLSVLIYDTYEPNRHAAYQLLSALNGVLPGLENRVVVEQLLHRGLKMGNLPEFENSEGTAFNDESEEMIEPEERTSKSQLVLHECFRTVKEASAVLDAILSNQTLLRSMDANDMTLLNPSHVIKSGESLRHLLTAIRHKGAFSGVNTSFAQLCVALFSTKIAIFEQLPTMWLKDFLEQMSRRDISITRRSGGLPLGIVAILKAPSRFQTAAIQQTMESLFAICGKPYEGGEDLTDLPQVHAFNIISFPIRNCATMLFSTLIAKSLGVKKAKDEHDIVNTVTGREFFSRFPTLHQFLIDELQLSISTSSSVLEIVKVQLVETGAQADALRNVIQKLCNALYDSIWILTESRCPPNIELYLKICYDLLAPCRKDESLHSAHLPLVKEICKFSIAFLANLPLPSTAPSFQASCQMMSRFVLSCEPILRNLPGFSTAEWDSLLVKLLDSKLPEVQVEVVRHILQKGLQLQPAIYQKLISLISASLTSQNSIDCQTWEVVYMSIKAIVDLNSEETLPKEIAGLEFWKKLMGVRGCRNTYLVEAILPLISHVFKSLIKTKAFGLEEASREFLPLIDLFIHESQPDYIRQSAVESLQLVQELFKEGGEGYLEYLILLDKLLVDDDSEVRLGGSKLAAKVLGEGDECSSVRVRQVLFKRFEQVQLRDGEIKLLMDYVSWLFLGYDATTTTKATQSNGSAVTVLFVKESENTYKEDVMNCLLVSKLLSKLQTNSAHLAEVKLLVEKLTGCVLAQLNLVVASTLLQKENFEHSFKLEMQRILLKKLVGGYDGNVVAEVEGKVALGKDEVFGNVLRQLEECGEQSPLFSLIPSFFI